MKSFTGFFSIIACGLIAGAILVSTMQKGIAPFISATNPDAFIKVDYPSLILGIFVGAITMLIATTEWSTLPTRIGNWFVRSAPAFGYILLGLGFAAIVIYY